MTDDVHVQDKPCYRFRLVTYEQLKLYLLVNETSLLYSDE